MNLKKTVFAPLPPAASAARCGPHITPSPSPRYASVCLCCVECSEYVLFSTLTVRSVISDCVVLYTHADCVHYYYYY